MWNVKHGNIDAQLRAPDRVVLFRGRRLWHQVSQVWSLELLSFWECYHLCVSKFLYFGYMRVFTMWLYMHMYVAEPPLWTINRYGLSLWTVCMDIWVECNGAVTV